MHAFPIVPAEDLSEVARFRIDLVRALVSATVGSPEAARLWKVPTNSDRILFCPRPGEVAPFAVVGLSIAVPNQHQSTSRVGLPRSLSASDSLQPGSGPNCVARPSVFPTLHCSGPRY